MFSAGDAYERFMGRWSRSLAPLLVRFAGVREDDRVLDVGTGTGALAAAAALAAPSGRVLGIDPADTYVASARARHGTDRVAFEVGDARHLACEDASFDCVLSMLILNFIPDRDRALAEMIRVARPGGIVAAAVWDYGGGMEMLRTFWDEATALDAGLEAKDERHMPLCRKGELDALWRAHGLLEVREEPLTIDTRFESFDDYWRPFLGGQGPAGACVAALADETREHLRQRLFRRLRGTGADGAITLTARAWAVRGVVPPR